MKLVQKFKLTVIIGRSLCGDVNGRTVNEENLSLFVSHGVDGGTIDRMTDWQNAISFKYFQSHKHIINRKPIQNDKPNRWSLDHIDTSATASTVRSATIYVVERLGTLAS